jgi:hypothetical protein
VLQGGHAACILAERVEKPTDNRSALLMLANGFTHELIAGLALAGLVTVVTDTARFGEQTIEVQLVIITDDGRRALEDALRRSRNVPMWLVLDSNLRFPDQAGAS